MFVIPKTIIPFVFPSEASFSYHLQFMLNIPHATPTWSKSLISCSVISSWPLWYAHSPKKVFLCSIWCSHWASDESHDFYVIYKHYMQFQEVPRPPRPIRELNTMNTCSNLSVLFYGYRTVYSFSRIARFLLPPFILCSATSFLWECPVIFKFHFCHPLILGIVVSYWLLINKT